MYDLLHITEGQKDSTLEMVLSSNRPDRTLLLFFGMCWRWCYSWDCSNKNIAVNEFKMRQALLFFFVALFHQKNLYLSSEASYYNTPPWVPKIEMTTLSILGVWAGIIQRRCTTSCDGVLVCYQAQLGWSHFLLLLPAHPDKGTHFKPHGSLSSLGSGTISKAISFHIKAMPACQMVQNKYPLHFPVLLIVVVLSSPVDVEKSSEAFRCPATWVCDCCGVVIADGGDSVGKEEV